MVMGEKLLINIKRRNQNDVLNIFQSGLEFVKIVSMINNIDKRLKDLDYSIMHIS